MVHVWLMVNLRIPALETSGFNSLPNDKFLGWSKLKAFADGT